MYAEGHYSDGCMRIAQGTVCHKFAVPGQETSVDGGTQSGLAIFPHPRYTLEKENGFLAV